MNNLTSAIPNIAISTGDPAGVGPELSLRVIEKVSSICRPVLFGDARVLAAVASKLGLALPPSVSLEDVSRPKPGQTDAVVVDVPNIELSQFEPGTVNAFTGRASYDYVIHAIDACVAGTTTAMVTGPINKDALNAGGIAYPGHTEILEEKTGAPRICMMLTSNEITCSVVTAHVGLHEVPGLLTQQRVLDAIELSHAALTRMRGHAARLVVCGLNPHAGEGGLFGNREEETIIQPAIAQAKALGIDVIGPLPADTAFIPSIRKKTDGYICMYHDQGLIPLKALAFDTAVNVTLGLPIVRTSVDHGTALDLAWKGTANVSSFVEAVDLAVRLSK